MKFSIIKTWFEKYERLFAPVVFIAGFLWDSLMLTRIDLWYDHAALISYLLIAGTGILLINAYQSGRARFRFLEEYAALLTLPIQFAFGALFSGFFIFYSRSASLASSWPFLAFLTFFLVGNEFFRRRYTIFIFQLSIFFIALFSYTTFALPIFFGKMGSSIFFTSGLISVAAILIFILFLSRITRDGISKHRKPLFYSIGSIYAAFNIFYFSNIIPPIPLSLKEIGVYHSVVKTGDGYILLAEPAPKYILFQNYSGIFHRTEGEATYVYSAIFAPTKLSAKIFHRWQYFDDKSREWTETDYIQYAIVGGRDGGYRGFTLKQNIVPGLWRVDVVTDRGQLLGRIKFRVIPAETPPDLKAIER
ncbi:MAG: DUF2914 domain-containing protein [Candidatus Sungbacteria bacterium]|nr:DUF2914 domain-containing protein [Candidatus Sungbacteria bacterium]